MTQAQRTSSVGFWILGVGLALVVLARGLDGLQLRRLAMKQAEVEKLSATQQPERPSRAAADLSDDLAAGRQLAMLDEPGLQLAQAEWGEVAPAPADDDAATLGPGDQPAQPKEAPWDGPVRQDRDNQREAREELKELQASQAGAAYLHEWIFLLGTLTLVAGLTVTAATGPGLSRIAAMVLAAILLVSLYIGGVAWIGSILNTVRGVGAM